MIGPKKSNAKSVRMTDEVLAYVNAFDGDGFNDKFERLVLFCQKSEDERRRMIEYYDGCIADKRALLSNLRRMGETLHQVDSYLTAISAWLETAVMTGDIYVPDDAD